MPKLLKSIFDLKLCVQSAPPVVLNLLGMFFVSYMFKDALKNGNLTNFPFILQSSCILGFKGNIELSYIMDLSTKRKIISNENGFSKIAISYSFNLIFQSLGIGLFIGLLSIINPWFKNSIKQRYILEVISVSVLTCCLTTLILIVLFILILEFCIFFSIEPENFLMPLLNILNDILVVKILYITYASLSLYSNHILMTFIFGFCVFGLFCLYISLKFHYSYPRYSAEALLILLFSITASGFILDKYSNPYPMIAPAYPVFTGMSSSIAFIFLHKKYSSLESDNINLISLKFTLLFVSSIISSFYIFISHAFIIKYTAIFSLFFIFMFIMQVLFLMKIIERIIYFLLKFDRNISADSVPITSSIADFLGIIILIMISFIEILIKF